MNIKTLLLRTCLIAIICYLAYTPSLLAQKPPVEKYSLIRIFANDKQMKAIQDKGLIYVIGVNRNPDFVDAEVLQTNVEVIQKMCNQVEIIIEDMTTHHEARANLEKVAKGKKVKKSPNSPVIPKK